MGAIVPQSIFVSATPGKYEQENQDAVVEQVVRPTGLIDPVVEIKPATGQVDDVIHELDRKSTRLNSSHVRISYAVFCLKKKKKKYNRQKLTENKNRT